MKILLLTSILLLSGTCLYAQDFITQAGSIAFFGEEPFDKIKGESKEVKSIIHSKTGYVEFHVLIKSFHFEYETMEKKFNEKVMESHLYPTAEFNGKIVNIESVDFTTPADYPITVEGKLTIHNVTRINSHPAVLSVTQNGLRANSEFEIDPEEFNLKVPRLLGKRMVKDIKVSVQMEYTSSEN